MQRPEWGFLSFPFNYGTGYRKSKWECKGRLNIYPSPPWNFLRDQLEHVYEIFIYFALIRLELNQRYLVKKLSHKANFLLASAVVQFFKTSISKGYFMNKVKIKTLALASLVCFAAFTGNANAKNAPACTCGGYWGEDTVPGSNPPTQNCFCQFGCSSDGPYQTYWFGGSNLDPIGTTSCSQWCQSYVNADASGHNPDCTAETVQQAS